MTNVHIEIKKSELGDDEVEGEIQAKEFVRCIHLLLGSAVGWDLIVTEDWYQGKFYGVPDYQAQALEVIVGQSIWDIRI